jgi:hypothetical protein
MTIYSKPTKNSGCRKAITVITSVALSASFSMPVEAQVLPSNAGHTCLATSTATPGHPSIPFSAWFTGGNPSVLNAAVTPADSLNFTNDTSLQNTDFYQWSFRMFLWLTSPTPATYGGTGLVMSSPEFYNVSADGTTLVANPTNPFLHLGPIQAAAMAKAHPPAPINLGLRVANLGPHGLPVIKDTAGRFFEVAPAKLSAKGRLLVIDGQNKEVEVSQVVRDTAGRIQILGIDNKAIIRPQLQIHPLAERKLGVTSRVLATQARPQFVLKITPPMIKDLGRFRGPIFLFPNGSVVPGVVGDSEGNVQMTQAGSLIYYGMAVNDVYAYYLTGQKDGAIPGNQFPINSTDLGHITSFATAHNHTLLDPNSLAMEIKTAWVDASTLPDPGDYIRMSAKVPSYNTGNPANWTVNGTRTITAALIGIHVVGSVAGHPEMVWATFEHVGNTPNVSYAYNDTGGTTHTNPADPIGPANKYLFCGTTALPQSGQSNPSFTPNAQVGAGGSIVATASSPTVTGTSVLRLSPWGASTNQTPNPLVGSVAASNTQIISINNDVHTQMNAADIRSKYLFLGATWTENGAASSTNFHGTNQPGIVVGTSDLANSTLETFTQSKVFVTGSFPGPTCLSCHVTNTNGVSHIYGGINPLF